MSQFPADTPHVVANRKASRDSGDSGSFYLERPDLQQIIVTVRAPGESRESKISIPFNVWLALIADHRTNT